ncbi:hypothetical protein D3C78_1405750 [compost metagenome]
MGRVVQLVLHGFEEQHAGLGLGVVIHAGGVQVEYLAVEHLLAGTNIADALQQLLPVAAAAQILQARIVHGEALDQVLAQALGGPDAEPGALLRLDPVADRDDDVEVIEVGRLGRKFGNTDFSHHLFRHQFAFLEDVLDMLVDGRLGLAKQLRHLLLAQPDRIAV